MADWPPRLSDRQLCSRTSGAADRNLGKVTRTEIKLLLSGKNQLSSRFFQIRIGMHNRLGVYPRTPLVGPIWDFDQTYGVSLVCSNVRCGRPPAAADTADPRTTCVCVQPLSRLARFGKQHECLGSCGKTIANRWCINIPREENIANRSQPDPLWDWHRRP